MRFKLWIEELEARQSSFKDIIVTFLKDELHIDDIDVILNMNTKQIDDSIISKLLQRGIIHTANPDVLTRIKDGISIRELVNLLAGGETKEPTEIPIKALPTV